jgi:hypothetical protein
MSEPAGENGRITYTVKELLGKLDNKLDLIVAQLATKAEAHEVEQLEVRVAVLEGSAATAAELEKQRKKLADERKRDRRWVLGLGIPTLVAVLGLSASLIFNLFG